MAHVDDGQLNALLDGELPPEAVRDALAHVATCAECARRLEEARAFLAEAGELLAVLTPPPRAAEPVAADAGPRIAKTSKEVAVSVDGRTEMTPAIRPVFKHEVPAPAPRRAWKMPDLEKLAWAASLVLCLGVGYLANEVYHLRKLQKTADNSRQLQATDLAVNSAAPAAPAELGSLERDARQSVGPSVRPSASPTVRRSVSPPAERPPNLSPARPKPPVTKPAPAFAQPRPEQLATNQPSPAAPPGAALGDIAGAGATNPARAAAGAGVRSEGRANALDEAAASRDVAERATVATAFRRATMEDAVRLLSGSIRLIDGMNPSRVEVGPGRLVPGANPDRDVVRVAYISGTQRLLLDQQLGDPAAGASFNGLMPGDTLVTALGSNGTQVRWIDRKFWLSLTGEMAADSVRALVERIR